MPIIGPHSNWIAAPAIILTTTRRRSRGGAGGGGGGFRAAGIPLV